MESIDVAVLLQQGEFSTAGENHLIIYVEFNGTNGITHFTLIENGKRILKETGLGKAITEYLITEWLKFKKDKPEKSRNDFLNQFTELPSLVKEPFNTIIDNHSLAI